MYGQRHAGAGGPDLVDPMQQSCRGGLADRIGFRCQTSVWGGQLHVLLQAPTFEPLHCRALEASLQIHHFTRPVPVPLQNTTACADTGRRHTSVNASCKLDEIAGSGSQVPTPLCSSAIPSSSGHSLLSTDPRGSCLRRLLTRIHERFYGPLASALLHHGTEVRAIGSFGSAASWISQPKGRPGDPRRVVTMR